MRPISARRPGSSGSPPGRSRRGSAPSTASRSGSTAAASARWTSTHGPSQELSADDVVQRAGPGRRRRRLHLQRPSAGGRQRLRGRAAASGAARSAHEAAEPHLMEDRLGWRYARSRRSGAPPGCCTSTSTTSRRSTTPTGISSATAPDRRGPPVEQPLRPADTLARVAGDEFVVVCEDIPTWRTPSRSPPGSTRARGAVRHRTERQSPSARASGSRCRRPQRARGRPDPARRRRAVRGQAPRRPPVDERDRPGADRDRAALQRGARPPTRDRRGRAPLVYQPIFELRRARRPRRGAAAVDPPRAGEIAPPAIVASAERTGLIRDLGTWVIRSACEQLRRWTDAGVAVDCVCVNVAAAEFTDPAYCRTVEARLRGGRGRAGAAVPRDHRERADRRRARARWRRSRPQARRRPAGARRLRHGLLLAELSQALPCRHGQDRPELCRRPLRRAVDEAIVSAVVTLAHRHRHVCGRRGRGGAAPAAAITRLGCDMAQGYLFARPMPAEAVPGRLEAGLSG